jgi:hypothetical protein
MYQSFTISWFMGDDADHGTTFTVADDDAVNVAHMLAAGFNTMSRNMLGDFVLGVVDTKAGTVQYDGKIEQIKRDDPWSVSQSFNFEASTAGDTLLTFFGLDEQTATTLRGDVKFHDDPGPASVETETIGPECFGTKNGDRVCWRGRNYVPQDEHEADMRKFADANAEANAAARAEMISFVKRAHAKMLKLEGTEYAKGRDLRQRWQGMLDVLAKFLVVTGEADKDESHAVARRLCEIDADEF